MERKGHPLSTEVNNSNDFCIVFGSSILFQIAGCNADAGVGEEEIVDIAQFKALAEGYSVWIEFSFKDCAYQFDMIL